MKTHSRVVFGMVAALVVAGCSEDGAVAPDVESAVEAAEPDLEAALGMSFEDIAQLPVHTTVAEPDAEGFALIHVGGGNVVDFEDLETGSHPGMSQHSPYHGITFSGAGNGLGGIGHYDYQPYGNPHSPTVFLYNAWGRDGEWMTFSPREFQGAWVGVPHGGTKKVWIEGWLNGSKVGETAHMTFVPGEPMKWLAAGWSGPVDKLVVRRTSGWWVMDDLTFGALDGTPPDIVANVSGTLGDNGWYVSDVDVSWTVTDDESDISSTDGCDDVTLSTDSHGTTYTCEATSDGGTASASVTVKRDATDPEIAYSGNAGSYDIADEVSITCSASDATSGLASDTCEDITGTAYTFGLGTTTFSASAEDNAGNTGSASGSFTVTVSTEGLCTLVGGFVSNGGVANSLCAKLRAAGRARNDRARTGSLQAFINEVEALSGKKIDADDAAILITLATALLP